MTIVERSAESVALEALADVVDPELGIDVVALGLVYDVAIDDEAIAVTLGLTSPVCPLADVMRKDAAYRLRLAFPAKKITVSMAPEIPWSPARMTEDARRLLGIEGPS